MKIQKICSALIGSLLLVSGGMTMQAFAEEETDSQIQIAEFRQVLAASPEEDGFHINEDGTASYVRDGVKQTGLFSVTPDFVMADFNGDGVANALDATTILQASAAAATGTQSANEILAEKTDFITSSYEALQIGDIDNDGYINAKDATQVLIYSAQAGTGSATKPLGYAMYCADADGNLQKGWIQEQDSTYYASDSYRLISGWTTLDGKHFYFNEDGNLVQDNIETINGKTYFLDSDGSCVTDTWVEIAGSMHYFGTTGEMMTGFQSINGSLYAFDEAGNAQNGWFTKDGSTYYAQDNGLLAVGIASIDGNSYYFDETGVMAKGWIKLEDAVRYANEDGILVTGEQEIDGQTYYFDEEGLLHNVGWLQEAEKRRYILKDGSYLTGIQRIGEDLYAFGSDGYMLEGWIMSGDKYYFALPDGLLCRGMFKFNEKTLYFDPTDGYMVTGSWVTMNGYQYYFDQNGIMVTGTYSIDGTSYHFDTDGHLLKRTVKICVDAGHYGKVNHSPVNAAYYESDFTWNYHFYLVDALKSHGMDVITTRQYKDVDMELEARGKASIGCDLFISVHSNATGNSQGSPIDGPLACCNVDGSTDVLGLRLAQTVAVVMQTNDPGTIWKREYPNRPGVDYYGVLRGAKSVGTPGILLEHSYHTNYRATVWLMDNSNLARMAEAEAQVIANYYGLE